MKQHDGRLVRAIKQALLPARSGFASGTVACAGMLFALGAGVAGAADAPPADAAESPALEEITVTGIKASIAAGISMKEESNSIIETISAEDLGKLPDLSIADSLARLPGLAAQRTDGRSNFISIRGFASDFSGTTFMGREQASSGENRGVEFDQYPAELINAVQVYKTPDASIIGQGLAGTVNLETIKPLSSNDLHLAVNARGEYGSYVNLNPGQGIGRAGSRVSFSIVDQFLDHTLGVAFGVARLDSPIQEEQYQAWYWGRNNGPANSNTYEGQGWAGHVPGLPDFAVSEEGNQARAKSLGQIRTGIMSVLEWAPNESIHSELDLFFSKFQDDVALNGLQWSSSPWDGINYTNVTTTGGVVTDGTINNLKPLMQNEYTKTGTKDFSAGWNNIFKVGDNWTFKTDLSYSSAKVHLNDGYAFTGPQQVYVDGVGFHIPASGYPNLSVPINLADPSIIGFTDPDAYSYNGRAEDDNQNDIIKAVRLDVKRSLGWIFKDVAVGFDYSDRKKVKAAEVQFAYLLGNGCSTAKTPACLAGPPYNPAMYTPIDPSLLYAPTSLAYVGVPGVINYNVWGALASQMYLVPDMSPNDYNRNYSIEEKVPVGYVMLDIDTNVGELFKVRGNVGVQFVHTTQITDALITDPGTGNPSGNVHTSFSYDEWLPSLNLVGTFGDRNYIRLALSRSMMRGRIDDEKSASSASVGTTGQWSGSGGNPYLKPYIAIGEDLSFEKVFGKASYFSVALFNKNLTSYIYTQTNYNYDFTGYSSPRPPSQQFGNIGTFSTPTNGSGGKIQGYELALALEGGLFTRFLDGFGVQANFAYTNNFVPTNILGTVPGGPTTFPGFSKKVGAVTLYYEKYGASLRVAETYRSPFTGESVGLFDQLGYTQVALDRTLNLQAGYEFQDGLLKGLSFMLQINNLSNSPYKTVQITTLPAGGSFTTPLEYDTYGRTFLFGVNYKL